MLKQAFTYIEPVVARTHGTVQGEKLEQAVDLFKDGQYLASLHALLDGLGASFRPKYGNESGTAFRIPHGSILVHIRVEGDELIIYADFLTIPEKHRVAMLRQVLEINTGKLMLARFIPDGDKLRMEYRCPMAQAHPVKIEGVLTNICMIGDRYDDEFCTKFGAERCYEPEITPYPEAELERVYEAIQRVCQRALDECAAFTTDREPQEAWAMLNATLRQIIYFARPQGDLERRIDRAISELDEDKPAGELVVHAENFLRELMAMSREEMAKSLYYVETLISAKGGSSLQNIQENLSTSFQRATKAIQEHDYQGCVLRTTYAFYTVYYYNDLQRNVNELWSRALAAASDKPLQEAASILYSAYRRVMETSQVGADDVDFVGSAYEAEEEKGSGILGAISRCFRSLFS